MGRALVFRRTAAGLRVEGEPPAEHTLSADEVRRKLTDGLARVTVTYDTLDGPLTYEVTGFEPVLDPDGAQAVDSAGNRRWNWTGWQARRVDGEG